MATPPNDMTVESSTEMTSGGPTRLPAVAQFAPGAIVAGRYRLVALLGRGGMGEVYRADDLTLDQPVALKFLPEDVAATDVRIAQFHNELRVARQVSHRNVCRLYDLGEADGRRFLTMEYVDGEDLSSSLRRFGRMPPDKAVQMARQLCAGIAAAHERHVLHRDLKPANVMLDGNGDVRITDFGIATLGESATRRDRRDSAIHGAGAARRRGGDHEERYLCARTDPLRDIHGKTCLRGEDARRVEATARHDDRDQPVVDRAGPRPGGGAGDSEMSGEASGETSRVGADRCGGAARRRPAGGRARGRRDAVARAPGRRG